MVQVIEDCERLRRILTMSSRSTMSGSGSPRRCSVKSSTLGGSGLEGGCVAPQQRCPSGQKIGVCQPWRSCDSTPDQVHCQCRHCLTQHLRRQPGPALATRASRGRRRRRGGGSRSSRTHAGVLPPRSPPFGDRSTESGCRCRQQPVSLVWRPAPATPFYFRPSSR